MKELFITISLFLINISIYGQFEIKAQLEVEADQEHAIFADSKNAYGVFASGTTGVWGIAQGKEGAGIYGHAGFGLHGVQGHADAFAQNGVQGWARGDAGNGVIGVGTGKDAKGVFGRAFDGGEWAAYFWGGKGVIIRPRLSIENHDPQYPIHAGTIGQGNGNGAHLTDGRKSAQVGYFNSLLAHDLDTRRLIADSHHHEGTVSDLSQMIPVKEFHL